MKRSVTWILMVGLGVLCIAPIAFAQVGDAATTPEIDAGAAAGALTMVVGALALLGERWRRK